MHFRDQIAAYRPVNQQERRDKGIIFRYLEDYSHNIHTRANMVAHLTSSGFIMNEDLSKVLVIYHKVYQAWGWTGGHMDGATDLLEVAIKEAQEETGVQNFRPLSKGLMSLDILPVWGHVKKGDYVSAHLHLNAAYVLIASEQEPLILNEEETEGVKWIEADSIDEYSDEPALIVVYKKLIEAARSYDASKAIDINPSQSTIKQEGFGKVLVDTAVPIAVHEAKSAYYKAKLVKEIAFRTGKTIAHGAESMLDKRTTRDKISKGINKMGDGNDGSKK